ncbi:conjugal transfer relaxosome component TraJ [uncultured Ruminococcus sp.]|nr:conjugal transfer relaxosome component TraJ [uncultured Clostridium sp.]SCI01345.1 conjugal transfer relaxosome component TraJ [uncultured Ruminococcus sp.]
MANYEIVKKIAVIGGKPDGVTKEINIVKWGVYDPAIYIRRWQGDIASKGISLKREEAQKLLECIENHTGGGRSMRSKTLGINVRVTPKEKQKLLKNAGYCTLSLSEYLRRLGLGKDVEATIQEKEYRVFRKLKQLKADCEQLEAGEIARRINEIIQELR